MPKVEILVLDYLPDDNGKYKLLSWNLFGGKAEYHLCRLPNQEEFVCLDENDIFKTLPNKHRGLIFRLNGKNGQTKIRTIISLI